MTQISEALGQRIREIRKSRRLTLEELGHAVNKSKATLSKYETGDIVMDVERLHEIARVLGVPVFSLLDAPDGESGGASPRGTQAGDIFSAPLLYLYYMGDMDGAEKILHRGVIERGAEGGAKLYGEAASLADYRRGSKIYDGQVREHSFFTRLAFEEERLREERIMMVFPVSGARDFILGHILTAGRSGFAAAKALISKRVMAENRRFLSLLKLSREEMRRARNTNYLIFDCV